MQVEGGLPEKTAASTILLILDAALMSQALDSTDLGFLHAEAHMQLQAGAGEQMVQALAQANIPTVLLPCVLCFSQINCTNKDYKVSISFGWNTLY